jgi:hypothetical protein
MSELESAIQRMVDECIDRALEAKLPEFIRALGLKEADDEDLELGDAEDVARILGYDLSSPENIRTSTKKVYALASQNRIPSVRISPKRLRFNLAKVKKVLDKGGNAEPYSRSA